MRLLPLLALSCLALACSDGTDPGEVSEAPQPATYAIREDAPVPTRVERKGGLLIEILVEGDKRRVRSGDWITVHYTGKIAETDRTFGDTRKSGVPYSTWLRSREVIKGWERGLEGLRVGTKLVLHIPSKLAYGERGMAQARIPAGADLVYEIEILNTADRPARR